MRKNVMICPTDQGNNISNVSLKPTEGRKSSVIGNTGINK